MINNCSNHVHPYLSSWQLCPSCWLRKKIFTSSLTFLSYPIQSSANPVYSAFLIQSKFAFSLLSFCHSDPNYYHFSLDYSSKLLSNSYSTCPSPFKFILNTTARMFLLNLRSYSFLVHKLLMAFSECLLIPLWENPESLGWTTGTYDLSPFYFSGVIS